MGSLVIPSFFFLHHQRPQPPLLALRPSASSRAAQQRQRPRPLQPGVLLVTRPSASRSNSDLSVLSVLCQISTSVAFPSSARRQQRCDEPSRTRSSHRGVDRDAGKHRGAEEPSRTESRQHRRPPPSPPWRAPSAGSQGYH